jgi:hypothetical protein
VAIARNFGIADRERRIYYGRARLSFAYRNPAARFQATFFENEFKETGRTPQQLHRRDPSLVVWIPN